jgi:opacity protein-like surface antigen
VKIVLVVALVTAGDLARADVGVDVGPRGGVAYRGDADAHVGVEARLSFPTSPLTIQPTFDYVLEEDQSLYQVGANALYGIPVGGLVQPYVGIGFTLNVFKLSEPSPNVDDEGNRLGATLLGGARLDLPWVSPFVQVAKSFGEFDALTASAGIAIRLREKHGALVPPELARFAITPYFASNVAGDVQSGRPGVGVSLGYRVHEHLGFELDAEMHGHFFRDEDVADIVGPGVDLDTSAALFSGSVVVPVCVRSALFGTWCPYATAGAGVTHAMFEGHTVMSGAKGFSATQNDLTLTCGLGITHVVSRRIALRVDARYFRALVDEDARSGGYFKDYGFLRMSAGVSVGLW